MADPLAGLRVVEVASWMAAPSAAALMADLGADVVKVEPRRGDAVRGLLRQPKPPAGDPEVDYSFTVDNRGKRSVSIDLDEPRGIELVHRLATGADVFVTNLLHQRQGRYSLDADTLLAMSPRLVHATLSGYGPVGPMAGEPGYDVTTFFGRGAVTDSMTDRGSIPPHPRPAQGDHAAGLSLLAAILAALRLVDQTDQGQVVEVNLLSTAAWTMATDLSAVLVDGRQPSRRDRHSMISPLANRYRTKDDRWVVFNMPEERWWQPFCAAVGRLAWVDDPRFVDVRARFHHMAEIVELIDHAIAERTLQDWSTVFDEAGLIWGPIATLSELAEDPQAEALGCFPTVDHPTGGFRTVGAPMAIRDVPIAPRGPAPSVGEHTHAVLSELGLDPHDIAALEDDGVVGPVRSGDGGQ